MRLAVLGPSRHPVVEPFAGGQESHTATLITALRERGVFVRLYAAPGTDPGLADELVLHPALPELSAVGALDPFLPEPSFLSDHQAHTSAVVDVVTRGDVDLVHNQSLSYLPLSLSRLVRAPMVTTLHTPPVAWMELGMGLARPDLSYVAVSAAIGRQWTTLPTPPETIHNGVDPSCFRVGPGGPRLAWVGRITPEKGTDLAIRAARVVDMPLDIIGPISDATWFAASVRPLLGGKVRYLGHLDQPAAAEVVGRSAAVLVTPRWSEPFGLVAAEAAMCATPVLAIAEGGLPEIVTPAVGLTVPVHDDDEQVAALAERVPEVVLLDRAGVRADVEHRLSLARMADDYIALFKRLIAS